LQQKVEVFIAGARKCIISGTTLRL